MDFSGTQGLGAQDRQDVGDQRGAKRYTSLIRAAKLVCRQGEFVCVIRDVSSTGVSLRTFHKLPTDQSLALELQNGESYEIRQVRQNGLEGSYRFDRPITVERLIHENWNYPKRQLRLTIAVPLTIATLTHRASATTLNVSQQGARVECDAPFAIDQMVRIESDLSREFRAKIRWRRDSQYGLVFEETFALRDFGILAARLQCPLLLDDDQR